MNIIIVGLNYLPEPVGIGPYTAGMAESLAEEGQCVTVVCGKPYYPAWKIDPAFAGDGVSISVERGVRVVRLPLYVPSSPTGRRRLLHHASFAARAAVAMFTEGRRLKPDIVIGIAPSLISSSVARLAARTLDAKLWLHIQDFELDAAFATGLLSDGGVPARVARYFESWSLSADRLSTISPQMRSKLVELGIPYEKTTEFRNWASIDNVTPLQGASSYRAEWGISRPHVALYSGNIANKQGIEIIIKAARILSGRRDLIFVICGNGPNRKRLVEASSGLDNVRFFDLQPMERLSDLLGLATVHLLPQIGSAADLVLPSKLGNMLASGRPVVATAAAGTGLAAEVEGCGIITAPEDAAAFAAAILTLIDDDEFRKQLGRSARKRALERWSKFQILKRFRQELSACVS